MGWQRPDEGKSSGLGDLLFVGGVALAEALSGSASCNLRFQTPPLTGLQIECVLFRIRNDSLASYLPFETTYCAFDTFVIVNLYLCHSRPPIAFMETDSLHNRWF